MKSDAEIALKARVPAHVVAAFVGLSAARVGHLEKEGYLQRGPDKLFSLQEAILAYINFLRDEARRSSKSRSASRLAEEKTEIAKINRLRLDRQLFDIEEGWAMFAEVFGAMKSELLGLPARLTRDGTERERIEVEVDGILNRCATRFKEEATLLGADGDDALSATEDDAGGMGETE